MSELYQFSEIYHLKIGDDVPQTGLARCNTKSSRHWTKYKKETFIRGEKFNVQSGSFEKIKGTRCKRCLQLLDSIR